MTIRTRLTVWYTVIIFSSLVIIGTMSYYELLVEPRHHESQAGKRDERETPDPDAFEDIATIVLACGLPGLLAIVGGWWLTRKALAPVGELVEAAERINDRNLNHPLPRTGNGDELDRLAEVLNRMTARLHTSFVRDREFALHASHELKTPLTILCGETETELADESLTAEQRERAVSRMEEYRRLSRIVSGLTLLAKADAGQIRLAKEPVRFDELVREVFADAQILAQSANLEVKLAACERSVLVGDRNRLRQLLLNLLDNAVKYNVRDGRITMGLLHTGNKMEFVMTNTGAGIPGDILPRVFERFFRGDAAHSSEIEGCGLGLSIAQWIVSAHEGEIKIASEPAKETSVTVWLPSIPEVKPG